MQAEPEPADQYAGFLMRAGGAALDLAFRHIILIPVALPLSDLAFRQGSVWPAAAFVGGYFLFLAGWLRWRGLTPGGLLLGYRVIDRTGGRLGWPAAARRLAPYLILEILQVVRLGVVLQAMDALGQPYVLKEVPELIRRHGGILNPLCALGPLILLADLAWILRSPRRQALTDLFAGAYVVPRAAVPQSTP